MGTLQLASIERAGESHEGEIYSCTFAPNGTFVLSAGWDGQLRLWDVATGQSLTSLRASPKPLSCCAFSPDGKQWLSGSMEGMLSFWDTVSHHCLQTFVAHTRPISAIQFAPNGAQLATASWDRQIALRKVGKEREIKNLTGHRDIVGGCRYTPDGGRLLSWSHDGTLKLWDTRSGDLIHTLDGHDDRVTAAAISPDNQWAVSGGRDGSVKVWDLNTGTAVTAVMQVAEIRGVFFLLDGQTVATVDQGGWLVLLSVPELELRSELDTGLKVMCGDLAPRGERIALGGEDGFVTVVDLEGFEDVPLLVTATQHVQTTSSFLGRFLGQKQTVTYSFTCPLCQSPGQSAKLPIEPISCPSCNRNLRLSYRAPQLQDLP